MDPANPIDEALRLHRNGRLDEARKIYLEILRTQPADANATYLLGMLNLSQGAIDAGIALLRQATALAPESAEVHNSLGAALATNRQWGPAVAAFRRSLMFEPNSNPTRFNLGMALAESGQIDSAITMFGEVLDREPGHADAHNHLGGALLAAGRFAEAAVACRQALALRPVFPEASYHLGVALLRTDRLDESIAALTEALRHRPDFAPAHNALGWAWQQQNQLTPALAAYRAALAIAPEFAEAEMHEGLAHLLAGNLPTGFRKYEARWRAERTVSRHAATRTLWSGGGVPLAGKSILLHAEQGLGDTLQFIRFAPLLAAQGASVYAEVQPPLKALLAASPLAAKFSARGELPPPTGFHCPLVSLPLACGVELATIPHDVPYLRVPGDRRQRWEKIGGDGPGLKVGFAWSGNPSHDNDRRRSIPLDLFAGLFAVPGCRFYCLQKELPAHAVAALTAAGIEDWSGRIADFADTAAIVAQLDLVISVDTAQAHLAGALGAATWVLLPFAPDWRWMLEREDSPWYPTARLFRQKQPGDWPEVIGRVAAELRALAAVRTSRGA